MTREASEVLRARGVGVRYGRRRILAEVDLELGEGEVLALLGRNGEGKTSLVRCCLGQQRPTAGSVELLGRDVWSRRAEVMEQVGYVPERSHAPSWRSARQLLTWGGAFWESWDEQGALARLGRSTVPLDLPLEKLSQGQRKQVEIVFALASRPRVLVLDDPALGLDPMARRALWRRLVEDLAEESVSVLLTTHELEAVERVADRIAILDRGTIRVDESLVELKERFRRLPPDLGDDLHTLATVRTAWGTRRVVDDWPGDEQAGELAERAEPMTLEEIFEALMEGER